MRKLIILEEASYTFWPSLSSKTMSLIFNKEEKSGFSKSIIEMIFSKTNKSPTHQASAWGLVWRDPKGFLISTNFRGSSSHFCFDHFYIVDFHSALTVAKRDFQREDWVKIYKLTLDKGLISGESADVVEKLFHVI